jgi:hypothetical protein
MKYVTVNSLLHKTKGAAAGCPPRNIRIRKLLTNNQKRTLYIGDFVVGIVL